MKEPEYSGTPRTYPRRISRQEAMRRRRRRARRRARRILVCVLVAVVALALVLGIPRLVDAVTAGAASTSAGSTSAGSTGAAASSTPAATPTPTPTATPEPTPSVDPNFVCTWDTTGEEGYDYLLAVNRVGNCVTVFTKDEAGNYTVPYFAMVASSGDATPIGTYHTIENYTWRYLEGNVYGQYATRITGHILFHSVPYFTQNKDDLEYEEFNKLGTPASLGCIRLQVADAKWIYDNCPIGTPTVLYDDPDCYGPLGRPDFVHIDTSDETLRGWDPTDPDPANPWAASGPQPTTQIPTA